MWVRTLHTLRNTAAIVHYWLANTLDRDGLPLPGTNPLWPVVRYGTLDNRWANADFRYAIMMSTGDGENVGDSGVCLGLFRHPQGATEGLEAVSRCLALQVQSCDLRPYQLYTGAQPKSDAERGERVIDGTASAERGERLSDIAGMTSPNPDAGLWGFPLTLADVNDAQANLRGVGVVIHSADHLVADHLAIPRGEWSRVLNTRGPAAPGGDQRQIFESVQSQRDAIRHDDALAQRHFHQASDAIAAAMDAPARSPSVVDGPARSPSVVDGPEWRFIALPADVVPVPTETRPQYIALPSGVVPVSIETRPQVSADLENARIRESVQRASATEDAVVAAVVAAIYSANAMVDEPPEPRGPRPPVARPEFS